MIKFDCKHDLRVFLMNETELRSFSDFQILTKIAFPDFTRNLENLQILKFVPVHCKATKKSVRMIKFDSKHDLNVFVFIPCNTTKVSQNNQIDCKHDLHVFSC